jgi:exopolyphosphatase/guanosine-5'-triphosphate,3'-diphosphate pyrophosphatase
LVRQAGVLDVGCHSALLSVVRRRTGPALEPVFSRKVRLRLQETLAPDGGLGESGVRSVQQAVAKAVAADPRLNLPEVFAFATSVIRDAPDCEEVIAEVARTTGVRLRVLPGEEEARLAYVAARQWAGPASGPLLVLDIGGGTLEIATGTGEQPLAVWSLPLGARTITRDWLPGGTAADVAALAGVRQHLRRFLGEVPGLPRVEPGGLSLACSKTFAQLARLAASLDGTAGAGGQLDLCDLRASLPLLCAADPKRRQRLPGISRHRTEQSLAGALVAEAVMEACGIDRVQICPWSTREGLLLERLGAPATTARPDDGTRPSPESGQT